MTHEPDEFTRGKVEAYIACGFTQEQVARRLSIDSKTLRKHYREELDHGADDVSMEIASNLVRLALNGDKTAIIFYLKTRLGWKENTNLSVTASDSGDGSGEMRVTFVPGIAPQARDEAGPSQS